MHRLQAALDSRFGCQQDHRYIVRVRIFLDELRQFQSVHIRHHQVGYHDVDVLRANDLFCLCTVRSGLYVIIAVEDADEELLHILTVIDNKDGTAVILWLLRQLLEFVLKRRLRRVIDNRQFFALNEFYVLVEMFLAGMQQDGHCCAFAYFAINFDMPVMQVH